MVSRDFPKGLGRNGREGWRNVPPTKLPAKLPSGNIYSSLLDRPKDLKMRFDDNNNNNNRILLEWKDFNLSCENLSRKCIPRWWKSKCNAFETLFPDFRSLFFEKISLTRIRCAYAGLHFQLIFQMGREWRIWALYIIYHGFRELLLTRLFRARWSRIRTVFLPSVLSLAPSRGNVSLNTHGRPFDFYGRKLRALARILVFYIYIHTRVCTHNGELEGRD